MAGSTTLGTSMLSTALAMDNGQDALEHTSYLMDQSVLSDRNYLDLSDLLQLVKHTQPTVSGRMDFDYPSLSDPTIGLSSVSELSNVKKIPLPAELVEQFGHMQCNCLMGLFPEISRAWLSIDSDIFVWNYEDGSDLAYFDGLGETILSAALVKPKQGIFQPHIQYLLCLTTPVDIVLLGVSFAKPSLELSDGTQFGEMHLLPEPLFSIPTDNIHFLNVTGTREGRIFMAGKDGCLYELTYQAEDGWFSRKCRKINHSTSKLSFVLPSFLNFSFVEDDPLVQLIVDDTRNILYSRSEKGTIQVYDLMEDGKGMGRAAAISQQTTMEYATLVTKTIDRSNFMTIVNISVIPRTESSHIHLVAITQSGIRIYFTTSPFGDNRGRPTMLSMVHVRLPPGFSMSSNVTKPSKIHAAHYNKGTLLMAASQTEDNDILWAISDDSFPFQRQLKETYECMPIDGRTWALAEIPAPGDDESSNTRAVFTDPFTGILPPSVVTQHMQPERRFVLINSQGSYVITKLRPVDQLRQLLLRCGPDSEDVMSFFQLHKNQACATCLLLACSQQLVEQRVSEMATRAFFLYGGEPEYNFNAIGAAGGGGGGMLATTIGPNITAAGAPSFIGSPMGNMNPAMLQTPGPGMHPNQMSTPFPHVAQQLSFQNQSVSMMPGSGGMPWAPVTGPEVNFSWRHNGVCLYIGRILRPLWDNQMVSEFKPPQGMKKYLCSAFNADEMSFVLQRLLDLRDFMNKNSGFASFLMAETFSATAAAQSHSTLRAGVVGRTVADSVTDEQLRRKYQAEAESQESSSLRKIQEFVNRTCECLGLWKILCDHQFHVIADGLVVDQQNSLRSLTFKHFVSLGKDLSSYLITSLINMYIDDNAATDAISERMREVCPSLYSVDDAVCSKGNEKLQTARSIQNPQERSRQLQDALKMYKQITTQLDLPVVCTQFAQARFYSGIVDLSLTAATRRDPQGLALHYYKNGEPIDDSQGIAHFTARMDSYKCITETLDYLLSTSMSHPQAPSVPKSPGPPPPADPNRLTNTEAERFAEEVYTQALESDDEMFHVSLYEWLIAKNHPEKLLEIQSPFLEPFLKRAASVHPDQLAYLDLLWKYYEKTRNYSAASGILAKLADRQGTDLTLTQRMEYLSRAAICAKSSTMRTSSGTEGEFLHELEEKMEVARIQLQVYEGIQRLTIPRDQADMQQLALSKLNSQLVDITGLYGDFADQFELPECKLAIIHCAGHYDPALVETLWQDITDKELRTSQDKNTLMTTLTNKLVKLGRTYGGSERYFPVAFLVRFLEQVSCENNFDLVNSMFVYRIMQEVGVTISKLHEIYNRLYKSKNSCWKALKKPYHLLFVIHDMLDLFARSPNLVPAYEKRLFTNTCLDAVANYLNELNAESSMNESVCRLKNSFKDLQSKLERIA